MNHVDLNEIENGAGDKRKMKEIRLMAELGIHENIIRYYSAWTEVVKSSKIKAIQTDAHRSSENFEYLRDDVLLKGCLQRVVYIQMELCTGFTLREWLDNSSRQV